MRGNVLIMAGAPAAVFPALACAREFQARGYADALAGHPRGIETSWCRPPGCRCTWIQVSACAAKGKLSLCSRRRSSWFVPCSRRAPMRELQPVCVLGMGGYVLPAPARLARTAEYGRAPLVIHEQNAVAGTASRSLAPFAARVQSLPEHLRQDCKLRAPPVTRCVRLSADAARRPQGRKPRLLVLGGSLGAEPLNKLIPAALANARPICVEEGVPHQAGKQHDAAVTAGDYREVAVEAGSRPSSKDMAGAYAWADLVICPCRGALTVSRLAAAGLPSFLVPLPHDRRPPDPQCRLSGQGGRRRPSAATCHWRGQSSPRPVDRGSDAP